MTFSLKALTLIFLAVFADEQVLLKSDQKWRQPQPLRFDGGIALKISGKVENSVIGPATIQGAYQAIYTTDDNAYVRNLTMQGLVLTDLGREGIRIRGDAQGVRIKDFTIRMVGRPQSGDQLPTGIVAFKGRNILVENGSIAGFQMIKVPMKYTNGDGFAAETGVNGLTIRNVQSNDNSDGGYDLKSTNTFLDRVGAARNGRNFRFWSSIRAGTLTVGDFRDAGIWIKGAAEPPTILIDRLIVRMRSPGTILKIEGGPALVRIGSCDIRAPAGSSLVEDESNASRLAFGSGCKV